MKTTKEGGIKLTRNDHRVGNFVFSDHSESIKVQDVSSTVVVKISKRTSVARMVSAAIGEGNDAFLRNYATMLYYVNGTVPDVELWREMNASLEACIRRHPELYGMKKEVDDTADADIIHQEKEFYEAVKEFSREPEDAPAEENQNRP